MLTNGEILSLASANGGSMRLAGGANFSGDDLQRFARAIEFAILAKQREQSEPFGYICLEMCKDHMKRVGCATIYKSASGEINFPLYTTPQLQRERSEPVAYVKGYYGGRCVAEPIGNDALVFPVGKAFFGSPQPLPEGMVMLRTKPPQEALQPFSDYAHGKLSLGEAYAAVIAAAEKEAKP